MKITKKILSIILITALLISTLPVMNFNKGKGVNAATGDEIVADAKSWIGITPYVYGGTDLYKGADCSGFVCAIYKRHGLDFISTYGVRSSYDMYANYSKFGVYVGNTADVVQPGYLLLTNPDGDGRPGHVGIGSVDANGNKEIIHASNSRRGTVCDSLSWYLNSTTIVAVIAPTALNGVLYSSVTSAGEVAPTVSPEATPTPAPEQTQTPEQISEEEAKKANPGYPYELQTGKITKNSGNNAVMWLQTALNTVNNAGLKVDGSYGPITKGAVKKFQKAYGLDKKNGKANAATVAKLTSVHVINQSITSIQLDHEAETTLEEGQIMDLHVVVTPIEAEGVSINWTSSDKRIAKISSDGSIKALRPGTVNITATTPNGITTEKVLTIEKSHHKSEWLNGLYYNSKGKQKKKAVGSWKKVKGQLTFGDTSGWRARNEWVRIDEKNYYFDYNGYAIKNCWRKIGNKWYYFKRDGSRAENEWVKGKYLNKKGVRNNKRTAAWEKTDAGWMYKDNQDWFANSTTIIIDNKTYTFDENGICAEKK